MAACVDSGPAGRTDGLRLFKTGLSRVQVAFHLVVGGHRRTHAIKIPTPLLAVEARRKLLSDLLHDPEHRGVAARMEMIRVLMGIASKCLQGSRPEPAHEEEGASDEEGSGTEGEESPEWTEESLKVHLGLLKEDFV